MTKKSLKILLSIFFIITMAFSFSTHFVEATEEAVTTSETEATTTTETTEPEIHNGDLYLFDNKVVMDQLVDGNVFIIGQEVEITGQVNGSLFVCANKLTFDQCYVKNNIFACANSVYYNGACNDFYVISSNDLEMTYDSYIVRDIKGLANNITFKAAVGRDVDLSFNNINLGEGEDIPIIYGDFRYTAPSEITVPEGVMADSGNVTYTSQVEAQNTTSSITDILINSIICIVTVLALYFILVKINPKFIEKLSNEKISFIKLLKAFGLGIASIVIVSLFFILLAGTTVGIKLAFILVLLFIVLWLISVPVFAITITKTAKLQKTPIFCLILSAISVVLYLVTLTPFVGWIFSLLITPTAIGMLINMFIPHKELTEEEKTAIEEAKKLAKENREKIKQQKLETKATKKQEKAAAKEEKKNDKEI